ncbi:MAG TPA: alpha-1,4-glucan--maltose-1-phosphate maltosyltransferase [Herbaspirillum sp.]|jgi:starch synthase (maltosyl-transferring)
MPPKLSPRIYCINPLLVGFHGWPQLLDHCVALGFDHVLIARDIAGVGSTATAVAMAGAADTALEALLHECAARDVRVLVDLSLAAVGSRDPLLRQHPEWFDPPQAAHAAALDPRHYSAGQASARMRWEDPAAAEAALAWWREHLADLTDLGVAGFVCCAPAHTPCEIWKSLSAPLRERHACCHLLAWTPGCSTAQLTQFAHCGFDAVFHSGAWWDFRADWWAREHEYLRAIAAPIAFPEDPFGPRLARQWQWNDPDSQRGGALRALRFAAATGSGWLMPMGFEYGLQEPLFGGFPDADGYRQACSRSLYDLSAEIAEANRFMAATGSRYHGARISMRSAPHAPLALIERRLLSDDTLPPLHIAVNSDLHLAQFKPPALQPDAEILLGASGAAETVSQTALEAASETVPDADPLARDTVAAGALLILRRPIAPPVAVIPNRSKRPAQLAARAPRIAIEAVTPVADNGRFPIKRVVGDNLTVEADILIDGHDHLAAQVVWRTADSREWQAVPMRHAGNDRWQARVPLQRVGRHFFAIEAWRDAFESYRDELEKKSRAGLDLTLELEEGRLLVVQAADAGGEDTNTLKDIARELEGKIKFGAKGKAKTKAVDADQLALDNAARTARLLSREVETLMQRNLPRRFMARSEVDYPVDVERGAARFASWYELFPRSQSGEEHRHGTFLDVIERLPEIAAMGFDTLYFPPIHPIGRRNRKGRNNSLTPSADDPGSPYAIGAEEGGHDAIHPALGKLDDFRALRKAAAAHGLELALDFAIQCAPDHPWLTEHPDWFAWRPDGSMRYAENPPKKYEDIVNVDFYADGAVPDLWIALRDVVLLWAGEGVRTFRVDNPHTKPLPFWEWMIADIRSRYPDTLFLSEAFTRPKMMYRLAKAGFSQSYTYFTWRHTKQEFIDYLVELNRPPVRDFFRPNFFVNTPDINPYFLQRSGRPGFLIRAALAATLSGLWGVYSGFELCEATPVPGKEEYLNSEKYQIRAWDWKRPGNIVAEITQLNQLRRANPALQTHTGVHFQPIGDGNLLAFIKATERPGDASRFGDNVVLVVINLDPFNTHAGEIALPLWQFDLPDHGVLAVEDLTRGHRFDWHGNRQIITLNPNDTPYAIWRLRPQGQP